MGSDEAAGTRRAAAVGGNLAERATHVTQTLNPTPYGLVEPDYV